MSNVFFIKDSRVYTPPLESVLPGITRKHIISTCKKLGIPILESKISIEDLKGFDSVFLSSTSSNALPVSDIEGISFGTQNTILLSIMNEFNNTIREYITNFTK